MKNEMLMKTGWPVDKNVCMQTTDNIKIFSINDIKQTSQSFITTKEL
jgi:hypothetical protein